eukprot:TRINITY_DN8592_c0_g1_i4.p1 TRINITY_DN8592_c0_g1~~TRINITY_DN8592_c0_g1_i4.p1  ORF type:complete len:277 (-),score=46.99 TRINITY_DN8592_c0_g1_i4:107-937(-)
MHPAAAKLELSYLKVVGILAAFYFIDWLLRYPILIQDSTVLQTQRWRVENACLRRDPRMLCSSWVSYYFFMEGSLCGVKLLLLLVVGVLSCRFWRIGGLLVAHVDVWKLLALIQIINFANVTLYAMFFASSFRQWKQESLPVGILVMLFSTWPPLAGEVGRRKLGQLHRSRLDLETSAHSKAVESLPETTFKELSEDMPSQEDQSCPVCLEEFAEEDAVCQLPCKHTFHADCIRGWLKDRHRGCPMRCTEHPLGAPQVVGVEIDAFDMPGVVRDDH